MRIAVWHNLPSGGGKRALHAHVKGLLERGHEIEVWCPSSADGSYLPLGDMVREHARVIGPKREKPKLTLREIVRNERADIEEMDRHCRDCAREIEAGRFDVLLAGSCHHFSVSSIARHVSLPSALYLQEPYRPLYEAMPGVVWWANRRRRPGLRRLVADYRLTQALRIQARDEAENACAFDVILVNSLYSRESVLRAYGLDARVCYLGIDVDVFRPTGVGREGYVLGLGALMPHKNVGFVIDALARCEGKPPRLVWIANVAAPFYVNQLMAEARNRGVDFTPLIGISDADLVAHLNTASVMVYAPRLEPFGLAPLEAAACELPTVAVAEAGVRESIEDGATGVLVDNDPQALAAVVGGLLADPARARAMGRQARENVEKFWTADLAAARLEEQLLALAGGTR